MSVGYHLFFFQFYRHVPVQQLHYQLQMTFLLSPPQDTALGRMTSKANKETQRYIKWDAMGLYATLV